MKVRPTCDIDVPNVKRQTSAGSHGGQRKIHVNGPIA
jgi:hypothetical protein